MGSALISRVHSGVGLTDPDRGVSLKLTTQESKLDKRIFSASALKIILPKGVAPTELLALDGFSEMSKSIEQMEVEFARSFYTRVRRAYKGTGALQLPALAPHTIYNRRSLGIGGSVPYYETGEWYSNGIILNRDTNTVYIRDGYHSARKKGQKRIKYIELFMINEFGRRDKNIPARPVFRPILRQLLKEYEKQLIRLVRTHLS